MIRDASIMIRSQYVRLNRKGRNLSFGSRKGVCHDQISKSNGIFNFSMESISWRPVIK